VCVKCDNCVGSSPRFSRSLQGSPCVNGKAGSDVQMCWCSFCFVIVLVYLFYLFFVAAQGGGASVAAVSLGEKNRETERETAQRDMQRIGIGTNKKRTQSDSTNELFDVKEAVCD